MSVTITLEAPSVEEAVAEVLAARRGAEVRPEPPMTREEFMDFCAEYPDVRAELSPEGVLEIAPPMTLDSSEDDLQPFFLLKLWQRAGGRGKVYGSSARFTLPDGSVRQPDAAWLSPTTVDAAAPAEFQTMGHIVPDFVIEVMSKTDRLLRAQRKMEAVWMANGVRLAWLIAPMKEQVYIYRRGAPEPELVEGFDGPLSAGEVVPGFAMDLRELR